MITYALIVFVFWVALGAVFFFRHLGDKYRKESWLDWIIILPFFGLVVILSWVIERFKK